LAVAANAAWAADAKSDRPNIILILTDDVGLGDIHATGGPFKTPNIDKIGEKGIRFANCYSSAVCGPSRCELLTGRYPFRTGLNNNQSRNAVDPQHEVMIPTVMKKAGYATGSVGKWGQIQLGPGEWGFDEYLVFPGSGRYWRDQTKTYRVNGEQKELDEGEYLPDIMHQFAADFIAKHKDEPFFLYYPMSHIHGPIVKTPDSKEGADKDQLYTDNVEYMDKLVGKLMDELDKNKLTEKTVVIFLGDNGTATFGVKAATVDGKAISGQKNTMLEGGARVPMLVQWPAKTPAGKVSEDLIDFTDFFVTCADLGGAELPEGVTLDGESFAPQLKGEKGTPRDWVYVELNGRSYVRGPKYKLMRSGALFDMSEAPFKEIEVTDVDSNNEAAEAKATLRKVLADHKAKPADPNSKNPLGNKGGKKKGKKRARQQAAG
jgi:arylsulfatase A